MNVKIMELKTFVSCITVNNRLHANFIRTANNALKLNYVKYGYIFIENSNIVVPDNLWQDGFHLNDSENSKLLNNLLDFLNNNIF